MALAGPQHLPDYGSMGGPGQASEPPDARMAERARAGREVYQGARTRTLRGLWRTIDVMETVVRVELGVARTLQALSLRDGTEAGARRMRLAREAIGGANTAIDRSMHLQREVYRLAAHGDVEEAMLRQLLERAAGVLAGLSSAEREDADTSPRLPGPAGSDRARQRRQLAHDASAGARRAAARARVLHELAAAGPAGDAARQRGPGTGC